MDKSSYRKHFTLKNLFPLHENPVIFTISLWQFNKSESHVLYSIYRAILAAFFITTWFQTIGTPSWGIYLTMWGYTVCTVQTTLGFLLTLSSILIGKICQTPSLHGIILKIYPLYWITHVTSVSIGFMITVIFWSLLFIDMPFTATNFFVHGSNSILMLLDLLIMGHPVRILHCIYPLLFGIAYVIFSIVYYFYDRDRGGTGLIYPILDWSDPGAATLVVVGITFFVIFLHLLTFGIHQLKLLLHNRIYPESTHLKENPTISTEELSRRF